jgi:hypothetical protein
MTNELGNTWEEALCPNLRYYPGIFPEGPRKATENLSQGQLVSRLRPPEAGVQTTWPWHSVSILFCAILQWYITYAVVKMLLNKHRTNELKSKEKCYGNSDQMAIMNN